MPYPYIISGSLQEAEINILGWIFSVSTIYIMQVILQSSISKSDKHNS